MDSDSDSSVDSVCFGPYTMKEARADIKKGKPRQIDRRHSCVSKYQFLDQKPSNSASTTYVTASSSFNTASNDSESFENSIISISSDGSEVNEFEQVNETYNTQDCSVESEKSPSTSYECNLDTSDDLNNTFDEINKLLAQSQVSNSPPSTPAPLTCLNSNARDLKTKSVPTFKIPSCKKLPNLKNIVSPVGVYIKHGPQYRPMTNVPDRKVATKLFPTNAIKENIPQQEDEFLLPPVVYKPAKQQVIDVATAKLPESIEKLVRPQTVIKHERRIEGRHHYQSVERRLMDADLSINDSQFEQDVSIVTQKAPFQF